MTEREELRQFITELQDIGQVGQELKTATKTGIRGVKAVKRYLSPERKYARMQKRALRKAHRLKKKEMRHGTAADVHAMKSKRAGLRYKGLTGTDEAYQINPVDLEKYSVRKRKIGYLKHKIKQRKYQYKKAKLQRAIAHKERMREHD
jgi:hypothetical protein